MEKKREDDEASKCAACLPCTYDALSQKRFACNALTRQDPCPLPPSPCTQTIDFDEMASGLKNFDYDPPIVLSAEDWDAITRGGALLNREKRLDMVNFEVAMRIQLGEYSQRLLANNMKGMVARGNAEMVPVLFAAKMAFLEIIEAAADRRHSAALDVCLCACACASQREEEG